MKAEGIGKPLIIAALSALVLYFGAFYWIEHVRNVKGPWQVAFQSDAQGQPSVRVSQETLHISDVTFVFVGERINQTNASNVVLFDSPKTNVPFGKVLFFDTTFLPGTVTFELFGHEIEFLPRILVVNYQEVPWKSGMTIQLSEKDRVPPRRKKR
jgi:hypothetical protein